MKLLNPKLAADAPARAIAPALATLDGRRIGLLSNGKANADLLLEKTAQLFVERHGCTVAGYADKGNASKPLPPEHFERLAPDCDFLITAVGD